MPSRSLVELLQQPLRFLLRRPIAQSSPSALASGGERRIREEQKMTKDDLMPICLLLGR